MTRIGMTVVLTEEVAVCDSLGMDLLIRGTQGVVKEDSGELITLETDKGTYENIPAASIEFLTEGKAA